jgi:hypothetical protein
MAEDGLMSASSLTSLLLLWAVAAPVTDDVVPMQSRNFRIPISPINAESRKKIKELQLFVSEDEGRTWNQKSSGPPEQTGFDFHAPHDGIYWFTVVVVDQAGNLSPRDPYKSAPGQKVLIDTVKPNARIVSAERRGDEIVVSWDIQEDHPDLSTLKVQYHATDLASWFSVTDAPKVLAGQARFSFMNNGPAIVRVEMLDKAGNMGGAQTEVAAKAVSSTSLMPASTRDGPALASPPSTLNSAPVPGGPFAATQTTGSPAGFPAANQTYNPNTAYNSNPTYNQSATTVPAPVRSTTDYRPPVRQDTEYRPPVRQDVDRTPPPFMPQADPRAPSDNVWIPSQVQPGATHQQVSGIYIPETSNSRYSPPNGYVQPQSTARFPSGPLPPLTITNSTEVTLNYEVTGAGPSGVGSVELYITQDDGLTWQRFADDPRCKPPMTVNLPGEGIYGLRLVVGSRAGLGRRAPRNGDVPQMRVQVDMTAPTAKLMYPQADAHRRDVLYLSWTASDPNPAPNPVTLLWSERQDGQWHTIADQLTNSGRYTWQLTQDLPVKVYLRILVRDAAGNVAVDELPQPVLVDLHEPEGQILSISSGGRHQ